MYALVTRFKKRALPRGSEYLRGLRVKREKLPHRTARVSKRIRQSALASIPWGPWGGAS